MTASDLYSRLRAASPSQRAEILLELAADRVSLPANNGAGAMLDGIDLSGQSATVRLASANLRGASLRSANLARMDLRGADLRGAKLGSANLEEAMLEEANLQNADMAGCRLADAALGGANMKGALLEDAKLPRAGMRFVNLHGAFLDAADLRRADLWGADLTEAVLKGADLHDSVLREANLAKADLSDANLVRALLPKANLQGANLANADLQGAKLDGANLRSAVLRGAKLQGVDLSTCDITHVHLGDAWLGKTRMRLGQLGGAVGEELAGEYDAAAHAYLALERNFAELADHDAASWAYRKRRRMQKLESLKKARQRKQQGHTRAALPHYRRYLAHQLVEWLCDYGEGISRVLLWMALVGLALLALSLWVPRSPVVTLCMSILMLLGIALTGLLGFIAGNRLRR